MLAGRRKRQWYVEPFVGGGNIFCKAANPKLGSDANTYIVDLLAYIAAGGVTPDDLSLDEWKMIRANQDGHPPWLVGFAGAACSFGGRWFEGYARPSAGITDSGHYAAQQSRTLQRQRAGLVGACFTHGDYHTLAIPARSIVYCDPPYVGTHNYGRGKWDADRFWRWAARLADKGHTVFVSEYAAPPGWDAVWTKTTCTNFDSARAGAATRVEHLFTRSKR